ENDIYKIQGIINTRKQQRYIDERAVLRLINVVKIGALDHYVNYHIVRSERFKEDIYLALGKINESALNKNNKRYKKSDKVYNFIIESMLEERKSFLSKDEVEILAEEVKETFDKRRESVGVFETIRNSIIGCEKIKPKNRYTSLSIFWGTNRKNLYYTEGLYFTNERNNSVERGEQLRVGRSLVTVPDIHIKGEIERPEKRWKFWKNTTENINQHIVIHTIDLMNKDEWKLSLQKESAEKEGLLFIHGYNCSFDDAIYRAAQLKFDLKFSGLTFCFSWASKAQVESYTVDEATIDWSTTHLEEFIDLITEELKLSKLHIIAHSMGNRALVDVIKQWNGRQDKVHTIVFAAPDVDSDKMKNTSAYFNVFENVTLYSSTNDIPVNISTAVHKYQRAGNSTPPLVMEHADTIDVSKIKKPLFSLGHSYYTEAYEVFNDLYYLINEKVPALKRNGITYKDDWKCFVLS
ncbi:alpha/beta hydrolase, partial [Proteus terrae]